MSSEPTPAGRRGLCLVISGPSGVGKGTLLSHLRTVFPDLGFSISATTRPPRIGEREGVDYDFLDPERFDEMARRGAFLEHATVYGHRYGTLRDRVVEELARGRSTILDIDAQGAAQVRETLPEAVHVFVAPPSMAELEARLRGRGTEDDATVARRMAKADEQLRAVDRYDYVVINDELDRARAELEAIVRAERLRVDRVRPRLHALLPWLDHEAPTR